MTKEGSVPGKITHLICQKWQGFTEASRKFWGSPDFTNASFDDLFSTMLPCLHLCFLTRGGVPHQGPSSHFQTPMPLPCHSSLSRRASVPYPIALFSTPSVISSPLSLYTHPPSHHLLLTV